MKKPVGDVSVDDSSTSDELVSEITNYAIQEYESIIKFR